MGTEICIVSMLESAELGSQLWFPERGSVLQHPDFKGVKFVLDFNPKWLLRLYYLKVSYFIDFFCCEKILEKEKEKKSYILAHVFFFFFQPAYCFGACDEAGHHGSQWVVEQRWLPCDTQ